MSQHLEFLRPYQDGEESFSLSSGDLTVPKFLLGFREWQGARISNSYRKTILDWNGEPVYAELAVLRLFQAHGWDGVWVDSYRRKYRTGLPDLDEPVTIPQDQVRLLDAIRARTGRPGGCWDVFVWKDDSIMFAELKRRRKDRFRASQIRWLDAAHQCGGGQLSFALMEWDLL